ncbi:MAG: tRNA lysidine(34) synthetase TilS [Candidatus Omnitrophica bacterium]|nr:tRNA lysidine(34) synthetase TilS [Candidatus Omnitrophota bacterium]
MKETVEKYHLLKLNDRVVVGVSGGPDSVALLLCLIALQKEYKLKIHVAHFDHGLRKEAQDDKKFVIKLCNKLAVDYTIGKIKKKNIAGSLEEYLRNERISFLCRVAKLKFANAIALGHTLDDQAETVLMRLLRGTGLQGLAAICPCRNLFGIRFIRPLLEVSRSQIEYFLRRKKIIPRIDHTNLKDIFFRNKIRNHLIPYLEKNFTPAIKTLLSQLADSVRFDYDFILHSTEKFLPRKNVKRICLKKLSSLHPAIARQLIRLMYVRLKGDSRKLTFRHIQLIENLCYYEKEGSIVDLPADISVRKKANTIEFFYRESSKS